MVARPFHVLGVQQIAVGARDRSALRELWVDRLGLVPVSTFRSAAENVDEEILRVGLGLGEVEIDLMQPLDDSARPTPHNPPLNHVGLWIDALRSAVAWLVTHGVRIAPGGIRRGAAVALVYLAFAAALIVSIWALATVVVDQTKTAANRFDTYFTEPNGQTGQTDADRDVDRLQHWLDTHPAPSAPRDPATFEDEDTLRRSFGGLSKFARREQRRPVPVRIDEYGYDKRGRYYADCDGAA